MSGITSFEIKKDVINPDISVNGISTKIKVKALNNKKWDVTQIINIPVIQAMNIPLKTEITKLKRFN